MMRLLREGGEMLPQELLPSVREAAGREEPQSVAFLAMLKMTGLGGVQESAAEGGALSQRAHELGSSQGSFRYAQHLMNEGQVQEGVVLLKQMAEGGNVMASERGRAEGAPRHGRCRH